MVDAADLKSAACLAWGFESPGGHAGRIMREQSHGRLTRAIDPVRHSEDGDAVSSLPAERIALPRCIAERAQTRAIRQFG